MDARAAVPASVAPVVDAVASVENRLASFQSHMKWLLHRHGFQLVACYALERQSRRQGVANKDSETHWKRLESHSVQKLL